MLIINGFVNCKQLLQKVSPNQKHFVALSSQWYDFVSFVVILIYNV